MQESNFIPFIYTKPSEDESLDRASRFFSDLDKRRSIRAFSTEPVSSEIIKKMIATASTAPSGAHKQPWTFCAITNSDLKSKIREAAEKEEYENYHGRMPKEWLDDLQQFETDWKKPFLEDAPWLIVVMRQNYGLDKQGNKEKYYYVQESVGIATGMLLAAIHQAGLVSLTHTPSPMNFLGEILERPENERAYLLIPVGYPAEDVGVPDLKRKTENEYLKIYK